MMEDQKLHLNKNSLIERRSNILLKHLYGMKKKDFPQGGSNSSVGAFGGNNFAANIGKSFSVISHESCCGIIGVVSKDNSSEQATDFLMEGLTILQNRGYDSAGICTVAKEEKSCEKEHKLFITKYASRMTTSDAIARLKKTLSVHKGHTIGVAHTRWATHGGKTDVNAHPHTDSKARIALVHNGVIENSNELRKELKEKHDIEFKSETDTEVIAQLIGIHLDSGHAFIEAIQKSLERLEGTWGLVIVSKSQPNCMVAVRNGSPLLVGISRGKTFVASESSAFSRHTKEFISLENGEIAVITADGVHEIFGSNPSKDMKDRLQKSEETEVQLTPHPYPHWTIKEITEQPEAVSRSLNFGGRFESDDRVKLGGLEANKSWLMKIHHLIIAACGTSYFSALYGAKLLRQLKCFETVQVIDAAELDADDFPTNHSGLLVISQSGETGDVMRCLNIAEQMNIPRFSIVNKVGSLIARTTGCGVYINAGREMAVASTKAFSCQVIVLCLITLFFAQNRHNDSHFVQERKQLIASLHRTPTYIGMILNTIKPVCQTISQKLIQHHTIFILGKGLGEPIAREGSLKIKEITYTHAEAYSSGALKHGPFALIDKGTPIIILILNDKYRALNITAAHEVRSRGAYVIGITDAPESAKEVCDDLIRIPSNGVLTSLLAVIPMQLIAYEMATMKGIDPDKPRHLAKSVTVY